MNNLSKIDIAQLAKNKNLLANIGIILVALIIVRNVHIGQLQKINLLKEQKNKENEISGFINSLKALEDQADNLAKGFHVNLTSDKVIEKVSLLGRKYNLKISSIDSQAAIDKKIYQLIPIRLKISSDYHKLGHFISDIEKTEILKVESLNINNRQIYYSEAPIESEISLDLAAVSLKKK